jgi:phage host-nuclease inhibitor protein Gam
MSKNRIKAAAIVIQSRDEMEQLVGQIASLISQQQAITAQQNTEQTLLTSRYADLTKPIVDSLKGKIALAQDWAERNPGAFGDARSIAMAHGTVGWRKGNPTLRLLNKKWNWEKVLEVLQAGGNAYVRNKPEVNKELLLSDRATLGEEGLKQFGVKVSQDDDFFIDTKAATTETRITEAA